MNPKLYSYQEEALGKMKNGCILCGGVGSGKSITALSYWRTREKTRGLYIITTAKKRDDGDWLKELEHFGEVAAVIDSWNNIKKYVGTNCGFFIFDEQRVVGNGAWVNAFLKICKSNHWILLSATPGDTWSDYIPVFIANGFYRNKTEFTTRHAVYDRFAKYPKINRYLDISTLNKHRSDILVDMDYHRPAERIMMDVPVAYDRFAYKDIMKNRFNYKTGKPIKNASELCYCLRECLYSDESRLKETERLISENNRVIIFYNFNYELDLLIGLCSEIGVPFAQWNGHEHEGIPDEDCWVYLVQYTAGAEGWNCITCNTIIFYSLNYSYKIMEQACGRIDRVNTPFEELYYYRLVSTAPIDLAVKRALKAKKKFNERRWAVN